MLCPKMCQASGSLVPSSCSGPGNEARPVVTHHCEHSSNAGAMANRKWVVDKGTWSEYMKQVQAVS